MSKPSVSPRALVLSPEAPYPIVGGGQLRTASLIEYLRRRYSVHVITFREAGSADVRGHFPSDVTIQVVELPRHAKSTAARGVRNLARAVRGVPPLVDRFAGFERAIASALHGRYEVGIIEHFWCAPYAAILKPQCERLLLNLHNIESSLLHRSRAGESLPARLLLARFAAACLRLEHRWYPEFDHLLVTSENDAAAVGERAVVYPNAIPWFDLPATPKKEEIVFSGNLEYHPNKRALRFFYDDIWPSLRRRYPDLIWQNVGRNHEWAAAVFSADRRVRFTGPVDNAIEALARARVAVVPLLAGSGTRFKIIEAWASGTPVVSTTVGAEGLPGVHGEHLLIADTPKDFIAAVTAVLDNDDFSHRLRAAGRRLYEECLTWHAAWEILSARLNI